MPRVCRFTLCCLLMSAFMAVSSCGNVCGQETAPAPARTDLSVKVHSGGSGKYMSGRWGMAKGILINHSDKPETVLMVVEPPDSFGVQFARRITVPAKLMYETQWPIRIPETTPGSLDFRCLVFPGGEDDGQLYTRDTDNLAYPEFNAIVGPVQPGMTGWLIDEGMDEDDYEATRNFIRTLRSAAMLDEAISPLFAKHLTSHPESLSIFDQIVVTSRDLTTQPGVCEAIRVWTQRGGRLVLLAEEAGMETADTLLGDALPMSLVGETSANDIRLDLNADYRQDQFPVRQVDRTFDEPIRYLRVVPGDGEAVWSVDGWPVMLRKPLGHGAVVVLTIEPDVFFQQRAEDMRAAFPFELIASSRRLSETLFGLGFPDLLKEAAVVEQATVQIGYEVPSRSHAILINLLFPALMTAAGWVLLKRKHGERLLWVVPAIALVVAVPTVLQAQRTRAVSPPTVVQHQLMFAVPGQNQLVDDGFATIYSPEPGELAITGTDGATIERRPDPSNRDTRRMVWTGVGSSYWDHLNEAAGQNSVGIRSAARLRSPMAASATVTADGVVGRLEAGGFPLPTSGVYAGMTPDRAPVIINSDGSFRIPTGELLAENQFFTDTLIGDQERSQSAIYASVFSPEGRVDAFPEEASLLWWTQPAETSLKLGDEGTRRISSLLVIQPLRLQPPAAGETVTIPSVLLPFIAIPDRDGRVSTAYNNAQRRWNPSESAGVTTVEFHIPSACLPFVTDAAVVSARISAGSRQVEVHAGLVDQPVAVRTLNSPVGTFEFVLPPEAIAATADQGRIIMQFTIGDMAKNNSAEDVDPLQQTGFSDQGEQDDSWSIDRLALTLKGHRVNPVSTTAAAGEN